MKKTKEMIIDVADERYLYGFYELLIKQLELPNTTGRNLDGIDDFYNNKELDTLSNGDETDNLESISNSADTQTDRFVNMLKLLPPKKQAIILNKVLESINLKGISNNWKRELISKLTLAAR